MTHFKSLFMNRVNKMSNNKTKLLQIRFTEGGLEQIEDLRVRAGLSSKADVIRHAISLFETYVDQAIEGGKILEYSNRGRSKAVIRPTIISA